MHTLRPGGHEMHIAPESDQVSAAFRYGVDEPCSGRTVLVMDDDAVFGREVAERFDQEKWKTYQVRTVADGLTLLSSNWVDMVMMSQELWRLQEQEISKKMRKYNDRMQIVVFARQPDIDSAVDALRAGAQDYLSGPLEIERLVLAVRRTLSLTDYDNLRCLEAYHRRHNSRRSLLFWGSGLLEVKHLMEMASSETAPVLITGETGTGKNLVARAIHDAGQKHANPFVSINCAALPDSLIEAELFGHAKGAFTGADTLRRGIFEMAQGGTLFLDEIADMPVHLQTKLLGVLEDKKMKRIGADAFIHVDVRIIAATSKDLMQSLGRTFRSDLYYRLSVIPIHLPPLRERRQDIAGLCGFLLERVINDRSGVRLDQHEIEALISYEWPGNVRELKNVLERAAILGKRRPTRPSELLLGVSRVSEVERQSNVSSESVKANDTRLSTLDEMERKHIVYALERYGNNFTQTAKALGIALSTLKRKLKAHGLR